MSESFEALSIEVFTKEDQKFWLRLWGDAASSCPAPDDTGKDAAWGCKECKDG
jgi:hypothetical protein